MPDGWACKCRALGRCSHIKALHHLLRGHGLLESGADLRTLQVYLGHAKPRTIAIYARVRPARLREAVDRLDFGAV